MEFTTKNTTKTTSKATRKTFVFNTVWYEIIARCSAQVKGEVFSSVMDYALYGKMPEDISNEANVIFRFIKIEIDRREKRRQRYQATKALKAALESSETLESLESFRSLDSLEEAPKEQRPLTRQQRRQLKREADKLQKKLKMVS